MVVTINGLSLFVLILASLEPVWERAHQFASSCFIFSVIWPQVWLAPVLEVYLWVDFFVNTGFIYEDVFWAIPVSLAWFWDLAGFMWQNEGILPQIQTNFHNGYCAVGTSDETQVFVEWQAKLYWLFGRVKISLCKTSFLMTSKN